MARYMTAGVRQWWPGSERSTRKAVYQRMVADTSDHGEAEDVLADLAKIKSHQAMR